MRRSLLSAALFAAIAFSVGSAQAATFTYHGNLQDAGKPADGSYDIELTLYSSPEGGKVVAGPLVMYKVPVHEGTFSTEADFGQLTNVSGQSWLSVAVRNAGKGEFAALSARAPISAAETATNSSCPGSWSLNGNAGNPVGDYLGTADSQPLIVKAGNSQVAKALLSSGGTVASWIGGGSLNSTTGSNGSFIGGGGSSTSSAAANSAGDYCVVGGGTGNQAGGSSSYATVAGGNGNVASGTGAAIGGGNANTASNNYATVPGGYSNTASGITSYAAGHYAQAIHAGSFVWADSTATSASPFASTGANQFLVKASGGVGINGVPKNSDTELSIYPGANNSFNYSNIFMGANGTPAGILVSAGDGSSLYIDQYAGTPQSQTRKLTVNSSGIVVNGGIGMNTPSQSDGWFELTSSDQSFGDIIYHTAGGYVSVYAGTDSTNGNQPNFDISTGFGSNGYLDFLSFNGTGHVCFLGCTVVNGKALQVGTDSSSGNGAYLSNGGTWTNASSRGFKDGFINVDVLDVLAKVAAMPLQSWFYRNDHDEGRHMGPVAEDFATLFALGNDNTHIGTVDESGVALAAIKGLNQKLESENAALQTKLDEVITRLNKLEAGKGR